MSKQIIVMETYVGIPFGTFHPIAGAVCQAVKAISPVGDFEHGEWEIQLSLDGGATYTPFCRFGAGHQNYFEIPRGSHGRFVCIIPPSNGDQPGSTCYLNINHNGSVEY